MGVIVHVHHRIIVMTKQDEALNVVFCIPLSIHQIVVMMMMMIKKMMSPALWKISVG